MLTFIIYTPNLRRPKKIFLLNKYVRHDEAALSVFNMSKCVGTSSCKVRTLQRTTAVNAAINEWWGSLDSASPHYQGVALPKFKRPGHEMQLIFFLDSTFIVPAAHS